MYRKKCKTCGKPFETSYPLRIYCHAPCGLNYYKRVPKPKIRGICLWCQESFSPFKSDVLFCCSDCAYAYRHMKERIGKMFCFVSDQPRANSELAKLRLEGRNYKLPERESA